MLSGKLVANWANLIDPRSFLGQERCYIRCRLPRAAWQHICDKHVGNPGEPWSKLCPLLDEVPRPGALRGFEPPSEVAHQLIDALEKQIRLALERPMVVLNRDPRKRGLSWDMTIVLPCGAIVGARLQKRWIRVKTCYFPGHKRVSRFRERHWMRTADRLVRRYGVFDQQRGLLPPEIFQNLLGGEVAGTNQVRFITLENWGFDPHSEDHPWQGGFPPWPEADSL